MSGFSLPLVMRRRGLRGLGYIAGALLLALLAWIGGFAWFVHGALQAGPPPPHADGIVVLTGGADRVQRGLQLLAEGQADRLLLSGVAPHSDLTELARLAGMRAAPLAGRVTVGHQATSTVGNAVETAAWARAHHIHTLIVVTAGYHMPRALTELGRALPGVTLYPAAVVPKVLRGRLDEESWRLLADEYTKWLAAELGVSHIVHLHGDGWADRGGSPSPGA